MQIMKYAVGSVSYLLASEEWDRRTNANIKPNSFSTGAFRVASLFVRGDGVVHGHEGSAVAEPEGAEGSEDDKREGVAQDELGHVTKCQDQGYALTYLTNTTENHQHTASKHVPANTGCSVTTSSSPSHEGPAQWSE